MGAYKGFTLHLWILLLVQDDADYDESCAIDNESHASYRKICSKLNVEYAKLFNLN